MAIIANMVVGLEAKYGAFQVGLARAEGLLDQFGTKAADVQDKINSQFTGTAGRDFSRAIEDQYKTRFMLEDKLYENTHTNQEIALRNSERYFGDMRIKWAEHEEMLTLITQTETAQRQRIMAGYATQTAATSGIMTTIMARGALTANLAFGRLGATILSSLAGTSAVVKAGLIAVAMYGISKASDTATKAIVAYREEGLEGLISTLPIVGGLIKNLTGLITTAVGGEYDLVAANKKLADSEDKLQRVIVRVNEHLEIRKRLTQTKEETERERALGRLTGTEKERLQLWYETEDKIRAIAEDEEAARQGGYLKEKLAQEMLNTRSALIANYEEQISRIAAKEKTEKRKPIDDITNALREKLNVGQQTEREIALQAAAQAGLNRWETRNIEQLYDEAQAMEDTNAKRKEQEDILEQYGKTAERVFAKTRTAAEKYNDIITEISGLRQLGLIDMETYARGVREARAELEESVGPKWKRVGGKSILVSPGEELPPMPKMPGTEMPPIPATVGIGKDNSEQYLSQMTNDLKELVRITRGQVE